MEHQTKHSRFRFFSLVLLIILIPPAFLLAQSQKLYFEEVRTPEGNPLGKIVDIARDKEGFMWFVDESNHRLVRYDGSHMKYFKHDPENPNTPGGYNPFKLAVAPSGEIWIGYRGDGLDRYDPYTNTFTHYRHDPDNPDSLPGDIVGSLFVDREGMVWLANGGGLVRLDPTTDMFTLYPHDAEDPTSLSNWGAWISYQDLTGTLWVGTGLPFPWIPPDEGGLNRFHPETDTFTRFLPDPEDPNSLTGYKVTALLEDSKGNFWVGTDGDGLHTMDRETGRFTRHTFDPEHPEKLSRPALTRDQYAFISFLIEDSTGQVWIGTTDNGVCRYNPETGEVRYFGVQSDQRVEVAENEDWRSFAKSNDAWCAYASDDGLVWVGTEFDPKLFKIDLYHNAIEVVKEPGATAIFEESQRILWRGTKEGLVKEDLEAGTEILYQHRPEDTTSIGNNWITSIARDIQGHLWVGTYNGLNELDPRTGRFTRYMPDPEDPASLSNNVVSNVVVTSSGDIWVGTEYGLNRFEPGSRKFQVYLPNPEDSTQIQSPWTGSILEDAQGYLWIGGEKVSRYNPRTETFKNYPIKAGELLIDLEGTLFAWNDLAIYEYLPDQDRFVDTGIISDNSEVIHDSRNRLWIHNTNGILRYDPETGLTTLFGENYGVRGVNTMFGENLFRMEDGTLVIGMDQEYYTFNPSEFWQSRDTSRVYATDMVISGSTEIPDTDISLLSHNGQDEVLTLGANQNAFSIGFSAIDFRSSGGAPIQYMLEGYDTEWIQGSAQFPAHYARVPPGDYTFRIRTVNSSSGIPSGNRVKLKILPPWWATGWAYAAYGLLLILGLWIVDRYRKNRVLRVAREKAQKRELEQAKEIEKAYSELKATQTQLIHSEKMASLGELTAGIAHEIQNPLNFVNNFSEVSRELIDEMKEEIKNKEFAEVDAIADDLKQNLEKITHHGKRADGIVKGMLQHSRISDGKKEPTDLNKLVDEYLRLAYHGMRARDKSFNVQMDTGLDESVGKVTVVSQDIGRVLLNLLTNAFHAVKEKSEQATEGYEPTVSVKTRKTGKWVQVEVADNGNGIPEAIRSKIFQPFFTTKPTGQGTGLGLSLSFDIAKAHGGDLQVKSTEGEGTAFTITLPA